MSRATQGILMLLLGGALLRMVHQGTHLNYVKQGLTIPLVLSGLVLVVVGAIEVWRSRSPDAVTAQEVDGAGNVPTGAHTDAHVEAHHDHSWGPRIAWLLLLPLFALYLVPPAALGADAAARTRTLTPTAAESVYPPLPPGDPADLTLIEYTNRAVFDAGASLGDREVALVGFVSQRPEEGWYLTRMAISCCAADALAVKVAVVGEAADMWATDSWVRVVGRWVAPGAAQPGEPEGLATIEALDVALTEQPAEPYEGQSY